MKTKLLVCGCAGFVLSSFIRYILYRTRGCGERGFEIIGIDNLDNINDYNKLYINRDHKFYIGDICDYSFIKKIIEIHHPDIIINGTNCSTENLLNHSSLVGGASVLSGFEPVIQLLPAEETDKYGVWNCIKKITLSNKKNVCIEFPNCFGRRQKKTEGVGFLYNSYINNKIFTSTQKLPWVFVEDVASFIWFAIENSIKGYIKMPALGYMSLLDMSKLIKENNTSLIEDSNKNPWEGICSDYKYSDIIKWKPDNNDIEIRFKETIKWYNVNRWAI